MVTAPLTRGSIITLIFSCLAMASIISVRETLSIMNVPFSAIRGCAAGAVAWPAGGGVAWPGAGAGALGVAGGVGRGGGRLWLGARWWLLRRGRSRGRRTRDLSHED